METSLLFVKDMFGQNKNVLTHFHVSTGLRAHLCSALEIACCRLFKLKTLI